MKGISPVETAVRAAPTSRSFFPRRLCQPRIPALLHPSFRKAQDEHSTPPQNLTRYCLRDFLFARGRCGVRQALVRPDHFWRRAPLRTADRRDPGGAREFSLPPRSSADLLEVDGRGIVSDAAFPSLLVLLRFAAPLFLSQSGHWGHTFPAGPRFLSLRICLEASLGFRRPRHAAPPSRFRAAHVLVAGALRISGPALATRHPRFLQVQSGLLSPRVDPASDDHHWARYRLETQHGTLAHLLRQFPLPVCPDRCGKSAAQCGHRPRCLLFRRFLRYAVPAFAAPGYRRRNLWAVPAARGRQNSESRNQPEPVDRAHRDGRHPLTASHRPDWLVRKECPRGCDCISSAPRLRSDVAAQRPGFPEADSSRQGASPYGSPLPGLA